jgi:hypothetical protein
MPTDLLLPAFALTLLANAALVAMAVRGLVRARAERDREDRSSQQRIESRATPAPTRLGAEPIATDSPGAPKPELAPPLIPTAAEPAVVGDPTPPATPAKPRRRTTPAAGASPPKPAASKPVPPKPVAPKPIAAKPAAPRSAEPTRPKRPSDGDSPRSESRRGGRRRFSLPPLDEDHERVNRSIETFLAGSDGVDAGEAGPASATIATTVAIVAIDGLDADASVADPGGVEGVVATVERTLRGAARSADRVSAAGIGRFRVVLPATGELAARAYLRRVRATVAPSLEAADTPLGLVTATATVLDDTVHVAVAQAEARLDAALAGAARRTSAIEPRVAPD